MVVDEVMIVDEKDPFVEKRSFASIFRVVRKVRGERTNFACIVVLWGVPTTTR